jgi:hypothetical protein
MAHLSDAELLKLRIDAFRRLESLSKKENEVPVVEASERKLSFRLDSGIARRRDGPSSITFAVQTKTGAAVDVAMKYQADHPEQVEVLRRDRNPVSLIPSRDRLEGLEHLQSHRRPLCIGQSVSYLTGPNGAIGCFVELDGEMGLLSASHVLANGGQLELPVESTKNYIFQPGCDREDTVIENAVGHLLGKAISIIKPRGLERDVKNIIPAGLGCPHEGKKITAITNLEDAYEGDAVFKIGPVTGYTKGTLKSTSQAVRKIDVPPVGICDFDNFVQVKWEDDEPFALPGDSGSLYVLEKNLSALALHVTSFDYRSSLRFDGVKKVIENLFQKPYTCSFGCSITALQERFEFALL